MDFSPTTKLDVEDSDSVQEVKEKISRFSAVLDRPYSDVKQIVNSSSKVRKCINGSQNRLEAQFCFSFGIIIVELTPYTEENFKDPNKASKTKITVLKDHIHTSEDNEKAFNILLEYLENKN